MTDLEATPWVDKTMRDVWGRIAAVVPESWMPLREGRKVKEYGCGHYGCVMPTSEPGLVCKLTTDISEARFVVQAMSLPETSGLVEYKDIYALKGLERSIGYGHRRRGCRGGCGEASRTRLTAFRAGVRPERFRYETSSHSRRQQSNEARVSPRDLHLPARVAWRSLALVRRTTTLQTRAARETERPFAFLELSRWPGRWL